MLKDKALRQAVQAKLDEEWSPEQIAAWLRRTYPDRRAWHLCHETIYQSIYQPARGGLSRRYTEQLRTGRPLRKRRRKPDQRTPRYIKPGLLIEHRPQIVEHRGRVGDWEGDLITGTASSSAIGTLVCRRSRYIKLIHLPGRHTAPALVEAMQATLSEMHESVRLTLTWDQGSEMAAHDQIAPLFREGVYFAHAGKPWQRPTNENSNGLLRQYFPKGSDLHIYTLDDLHAVEERINNRPRKILGWATPAEIMAAARASSRT